MEIGIGIILLIVIAAIAWPFLTGRAGQKAGKEAQRQEPGAMTTETLRYRVPDGQDPAVLMSALEQAGFRTAMDEQVAEKYLVVTCPHGREQDRPEIRTLLEGADSTSLEGPQVRTGRVTFEDEK
jgi:hypothetical protein